MDHEWDSRNNILKVAAPPGFDLAMTLECGQCFRWRREGDGSFTGVACGKTANVAQSGRELLFSIGSADEFEGFWMEYFDLGRDYEHIKHTLAEHDENMRRAVDYAGGIRILRQDPWETLISFIISQNANIPRIKKCIESLCRAFGEQITDGRGRMWHAFPTPEALGSCPEADVDHCRLGYRSGYVLETAAKVMEDGAGALAAARMLPGAEAEAYLRSFPGVGPKVADCVMLFGLGHYDRFPADVWIRRAMAAFYGFRESDARGIAAFAAAEFGPMAGFAQQFLFQYIRNTDSAVNASKGGSAC